MSDAVHRALQQRVRSGLTPQRVVRRAQIVLLSHEGVGDREIARRLDMHRHTLALWRTRVSRKAASLPSNAISRGVVAGQAELVQSIHDDRHGSESGVGVAIALLTQWVWPGVEDEW